MRQRINVIRALIHDPEIIFLDEPTTALDPQSTKFVRDIYWIEEGGHTIVLTTHIMEEADELSDRIALSITEKSWQPALLRDLRTSMVRIDA